MLYCALEKTNLILLHSGWVMSCSLTMCECACVLFQQLPQGSSQRSRPGESYKNHKIGLLGLQCKETSQYKLLFKANNRTSALHITLSLMVLSPTRHFKKQLMFIWKSYFCIEADHHSQTLPCWSTSRCDVQLCFHVQSPDNTLSKICFFYMAVLLCSVAP